jgi:DNA mismatch repair protein MutS
MDISGLLHWNIIDDDIETYKNFSSILYQNTFLKKIYNNTNFGLLEPIEFFDLETYQISVTNIIYILSFITNHDIKYVKNIQYPQIISEYGHLVLEMNTLNQLDIINTNTNFKNGSLFNIINKTNTLIGKRGLKNLLLKPFCDPKIINERYLLTTEFEKFLESIPKKNNKTISFILTEICDFEKLHRKMSLHVLHPHEFYSLHITYLKISKLIEIIKENKNDYLISNLLPDENNIKCLNTYIDEYSKLFSLEELKKYSLQDNSQSLQNFFNKKCIKEIDDIELKISNINKKINDLRNLLLYNDSVSQQNEKDNKKEELLKLSYSENDGYHFICTKSRCLTIQKSLDKELLSKLIIKTNTSICKIWTEDLKKLSLDLINTKDVLYKLIRHHYFISLENFFKKFNNLFHTLKLFIETLDIINSNILCKYSYNYCKPEIKIKQDSTQISFIEAKNMRHPIIERLNNKTEYVPNDISLNQNSKGMILYALNSSGKSSLLRSIGLCIVLAQCGLYVPCDEFVFYPFKSIITQVDMYDNLWKGQSSFVSEMIGLKKILKLADSHSLILSDELTKGTEVISATSIFASAVLELLKKNAKFIFTTHLQNVAKLDIITEKKDLNICHLNVEIIEENGKNNIIFHRKLTPGPCSELYGLEVAKAVGLENDFMNMAFDIRNNIINKKTKIISTKKSRYNKSKIVDVCEICNYYPSKKTDIPLDVHHIDFQCTADENNFTKHFHKNSNHNLVCLCKKCHQDVHSKKLNIKGYIQTSSGVKLNWNSL